MLSTFITACMVLAPVDSDVATDPVEPDVVDSDTAGPWLGLEAGDGAICALDLEGALTCWGDSTLSTAPDGEFIQVVLGSDWACAMDFDGALACWGDDGALPSNITQGTVQLLAAEGELMCALDDRSRAECWGCEGPNCDPPGSVFVGLAATADGACAVRGSGEIPCWGMTREDPPEQAIAPRSIDGGDAHYCARWHDDTVECWGDDSYGQSDVPNKAFAAVTAGAMHSCGLTSEGEAVCWGQDAWGETEAPEGVSFTHLSAGNGFTCGIRADTESLECWGNTDLGT